MHKKKKKTKNLRFILKRIFRKIFCPQMKSIRLISEKLYLENADESVLCIILHFTQDKLTARANGSVGSFQFVLPTSTCPVECSSTFHWHSNEIFCVFRSPVQPTSDALTFAANIKGSAFPRLRITT